MTPVAACGAGACAKSNAAIRSSFILEITLAKPFLARTGQTRPSTLVTRQSRRQKKKGCVLSYDAKNRLYGARSQG
jgi:hypothetical protein